MHCLFESGLGAELSDEFHWCADTVDRRNLQNPWIAEVYDPFVLVLLQQGIEDGTSLWAVLCEDVPLSHVLSPLTPG